MDEEKKVENVKVDDSFAVIDVESSIGEEEFQDVIENTENEPRKSVFEIVVTEDIDEGKEPTETSKSDEEVVGAEISPKVSFIDQMESLDYLVEESPKTKKSEEVDEKSLPSPGERARDIFSAEDKKLYFWKKLKKPKPIRIFSTPEEEQFHKQMVLARPINIIHTLFTLCELLCISFTELTNKSPCFKANELNLVTFYVATIHYSTFLSDVFLFTLMLINIKISFKPLAIVHNSLAFGLILFISIYLFCKLTWCGNTAQTFLSIVGSVGILASLLHLANLVLILLQYPKNYLKERLWTFKAKFQRTK